MGRKSGTMARALTITLDQGEGEPAPPPQSYITAVMRVCVLVGPMREEAAHVGEWNCFTCTGDQNAT